MLPLQPYKFVEISPARFGELETADLDIWKLCKDNLSLQTPRHRVRPLA